MFLKNDYKKFILMEGKCNKNIAFQFSLTATKIEKTGTCP